MQGSAIFSALRASGERNKALSHTSLVLRSVSRCSCVARGDTLTAEYTHLQLSLIASARAVVWCAETLTPSVSRALRAPKRETWALENTEHRKGEHPHRCMNQLSPVLSEHPEGVRYSRCNSSTLRALSYSSCCAPKHRPVQLCSPRRHSPCAICRVTDLHRSPLSNALRAPAERHSI